MLTVLLAASKPCNEELCSTRLLFPATAVGSDIWPSSSSSSNGSGASSSSSAKPLATWTITSDDEGLPLDSADLPPMTPAAVAASQTGAPHCFGSSWRMGRGCAGCVMQLH